MKLSFPFLKVERSAKPGTGSKKFSKLVILNWSSDILLPNFHLHVKWSEDSHVSFRFFPGMILQSTTPFFPEKKEEFFVISHGTRTMAIVRLDEKSCFFCVLTSFWWSNDEKRFEIFSWNYNLKLSKYWFDFTKLFTMMF